MINTVMFFFFFYLMHNHIFVLHFIQYINVH